MNNFNNILHTDGIQNSPGLKQIGYYAPKNEIANWPELISNPASAIEEVTLNGTFEMETEGFFRKLYSSEGKAKVTGETQGEEDNKTYLVKANFQIPGNSEEALAFSKLSKNSDLVFIFFQRNNERRVVGNNNWITKIKVTDTTGDENTSSNGITVEIETTDIGPAPFYNGAIPLTGAETVPAIS